MENLAEAYKRSLPVDGTVEKFPWTIAGAAFCAGYTACLEDEKVRTGKLVEALNMHHQWHQDIGAVTLDDGTELNLSLEYADSTMCEKTDEALARFEKGGDV